jgi:hypothetical protein
MPDYLLSDHDLEDLQEVAESVMDCTAVISRPTSPGEDGYGQPLPPTWTEHLTVECCIIQQKSGGEQDTNETAYLYDRYLILFPVGSDILASDRVDTILTRGGSEFDPTVQRYELIERVPEYADLAFLAEAIR